MNARRYLIALVLLVALPLGCQREPSGAQPESLSQTATVTRGTMAEVVHVAGQVSVPNSRTLSFGPYGGRVLEVMAQPGQAVEEGQPLLCVETSEQERELREAEADLKVAEARLAEAQRTSTEAEIAQAEASLAGAEAELSVAALKLRVALQAGLAPLEEAVADAQVALRLAQDQLKQLEFGGNQGEIRSLEYEQAFFQRTLRDLEPGQDPTSTQKALASVERKLANARGTREEALQKARDAVSTAEEELAEKQAALARARAGQEDPAAQARLDHEQATAKVEKGRKTVEELKAGGESAALSAARTTHEAALARVENARAAIEEATLTAPFDGVVFAVYAEVDQEVTPFADALYLADISDLRVQAQASEMDVTRLAVGQAVRVTLDAYPGKLFGGEILSLSTHGEGSGGVSFFGLEASLDAAGEDVRPGMMANLRAVIGEKQDVLTIPAAALRYRGLDMTYVVVETAEGQRREQVVRVGLNDGILVEVLEGLSEGETVVVPLVPPTEPRRYGPYMGPMY